MPGDAAELLEELRASGRRWVFGRRRAARARAAARHRRRSPSRSRSPSQRAAGCRLGRLLVRAAGSVPTVNSAEPMDVLVLIDKLDDLVHNAKAVPLTDQVRIDREEIYDILDQMRATIPEEIKQARWIVKERQEMLAEAKRECDRMLGEAREQAVREASQTEIVKLAERQAGDIVDDARRQARETRLEMEDWADSILSTLEVNLDKFLGRRQARPRAAARALAGVGRRRRRRRRREHERRLPAALGRWTPISPSRASATGEATPTGRCPRTCSAGSSTPAARAAARRTSSPGGSWSSRARRPRSGSAKVVYAAANVEIVRLRRRDRDRRRPLPARRRPCACRTCSWSPGTKASSRARTGSRTRRPPPARSASTRAGCR